VRRGGSIVAIGMPAAPPKVDLVAAILAEVDVITSVAHVCGSDLPAALELLARSEVADRSIERVIPLDRVVDEGLVQLAQGRARGKIVVDVQ
jgi:(R,R)-butanediol dehydrogenase/meso-butanediol dehydrogenase/diacetyl reductase